MDNIRKELKCNVCGKKRMLSKQEAAEDGWVIDTRRGLTCNNCLPKYGVPKTFFKGPNYIGLCETEGKTGVVIEF